MRKIFIAFLLLLLSVRGFSQKSVYWYDPVVVADKTYGNLHPRVVLDKSDNQVVIWGDINGNAFLSKWNGRNYSEPETMNSEGTHVFTESWSGPEIASKGDTMYLVYKQLPEDKGHILIRHSYDGGKTFSIEEEVEDSNVLLTRYPTVAIDPYGNPLVAFMKFDSGFKNPEYVVAKSTDLGDSFSHYAVVTDYSGGIVSDCCPATVIESGNATVALYRGNLRGVRNIWAGVSGNGGGSFTKGVQVERTNWSTTACQPNAPHGIIISDTIYSVFMSGGDSSLIYLGKTSLSTMSSSATPVTGNFPSLVGQNFPRIANLGNATAIVWEQSVATGTQICMSFVNDITKEFPSKYDTLIKGNLANADVVVGAGHIYVVWQDDSSGRVMSKVGRYEQTVANKMLAENTTIALITAPNGKYFTVSMPNISSIMMIDLAGKEYEMDTKCKKNSCKVNIEDMDPGIYIVRIFGRDDKVYNYKYEVKEIAEKPEKPDRK
ncbi:MAG: hypothetical protein JWQ38_58 [Flavipsychrobacter sp.]|nr:hypothetical protein [Flavipsychrobacter sp.]